MRIMSNSLHLLSTRSWVQNVYCDTLPEKGRILRASKGFAKHELVCEYEGDIITEDEADIRECDYQKKALPCCMLYFTGKQGEKLVCDPTMRDLPAKYISHCKNPNLYTQLYKTDTGYHIVLAAKVQIEPHEELYFDYFPGKRPDVSFRSYRRVCKIIVCLGTFYLTLFLYCTCNIYLYDLLGKVTCPLRATFNQHIIQ